MNKLLSLKIPGSDGNPVEIVAPPGIPTDTTVNLNTIVQWGLSLFLVITVILALGYLIYGGIMWSTSEGDKQKVESARKTIVYAVIGLIVAFLSFFVIMFFGKLLDLDLLKVAF